MSYYNLKKSTSDEKNKSFLEKYTETKNVNEAVIVSSLYLLHLAFGGKKSDPADPLPGVTTEFALRVIPASRVSFYADFKNRISADNAILQSKQSFSKDVDARPEEGMSQALSLYIAMNSRQNDLFFTG